MHEATRLVRGVEHAHLEVRVVMDGRLPTLPSAEERADRARARADATSVRMITLARFLAMLQLLGNGY
jgi:hypothetical protein